MSLTTMSSNPNRPDTGSSKTGGLHWFKERILGVFMIPLTGWFICFLLRFLSENSLKPLIFKNPIHMALMLMFIGVVFTHAYMGIQVVLEDYIVREDLRTSLKLLNLFVLFFLAVVAVISVLKLAIS